MNNYSTVQRLREELVSAARSLNSLGLNQGTSGNLSSRIKGGLLITPSSIPYEEMHSDDLVAIDLNGKTSIADYMVITSGSSRRKIIAMAEHLQKTIKSTGIKKISVEGGAECDWVLLDAGDIIIHLFRPEIRDFYK